MIIEHLLFSCVCCVICQTHTHTYYLLLFFLRKKKAMLGTGAACWQAHFTPACIPHHLGTPFPPSFPPHSLTHSQTHTHLSYLSFFFLSSFQSHLHSLKQEGLSPLSLARSKQPTRLLYIFILCVSLCVLVCRRQMESEIELAFRLFFTHSPTPGTGRDKYCQQ